MYWSPRCVARFFSFLLNGNSLDMDSVLEINKERLASFLWWHDKEARIFCMHWRRASTKDLNNQQLRDYMMENQPIMILYVKYQREDPCNYYDEQLKGMKHRLHAAMAISKNMNILDIYEGQLYCQFENFPGETMTRNVNGGSARFSEEMTTDGIFNPPPNTAHLLPPEIGMENVNMNYIDYTRYSSENCIQQVPPAHYANEKELMLLMSEVIQSDSLLRKNNAATMDTETERQSKIMNIKDWLLQTPPPSLYPGIVTDSLSIPSVMSHKLNARDADVSGTPMQALVPHQASLPQVSPEHCVPSPSKDLLQKILDNIDF